MILKSDWGGWLLLAAIVVFPLMLYLTQPTLINELEKTANSDTDEIFVNIMKQPQQRGGADQVSIPSEDSEPHVELRVGATIALTNFDDRLSDVSEISYQKLNYSRDEKTFLSEVASINSVVEEQRGDNISKTNFAIKNNSQGKAIIVSERKVRTVLVRVSNETAAPIENATTNEDNYLYLAEVDYSEQSIENKCPPVYQELNDYARNMRTAIGCDSE